MRFSASGRQYMLIVGVVILGCYLSLIALLNYFNYIKNLKSLTNTRFTVIANDVISSVEYGVNIGISLRELNTLKQLLVETKKKNTDISEILIIDENRDLLFIGVPETQKISAGLEEKLKNVNLDIKNNFLFERSYVLIFPITNQFDVRVGNLILRYPSALILQPIEEASHRFFINFAAAFIVCILVIYIVFRYIYSGFQPLSSAAGDCLETLATGDHKNKAFDPAVVDPAFQKFYDKTSRLLDKLLEAEKAVKNLEQNKLCRKNHL